GCGKPAPTPLRAGSRSAGMTTRCAPSHRHWASSCGRAAWAEGFARGPQTATRARTIVGLPDADPVFRRDPPRIRRGDVERVIPGVDVAQRRERADVARRMRAVDQLLAQRIVAPQGAPHLRPAHEEALLAGEAVDHRRLLPVE